MPFVDLPDVRLYYETRGAGPRLLLVSGTGSDLREQPNFLMSPLADEFELLGYDHRGLGQSEPTDADRQPTMAEMAADVVGLVDALGWTEFLVVGVSFGGMIAQEIALLVPDRVRRLVLACTSSGGAGGASYPLQDVYALAPDEQLATYVAILDTRTAHDAELRSVMTAWMGGRGRPDAVPPGLARQLEARRHHDTWDRLPGLTVPTLVAAGRYDGIAPLSNAEALAGRIPGARLQVFEGGHGFFLQDPTVWPAITEFLLGRSA